MEKSGGLGQPNERLRQERLRRNWRQREVADQLETTVVTVNRWERGIQQPSAYFRIKLCALFGKNEEELGILPIELTLASTEKISASSTITLGIEEELDFHSEELPLLLPEEEFISEKERDVSSSYELLVSSVEQSDITNDMPRSARSPQIAPFTPQQQQNRTRMLRRLRYSYRTLMAQSLQGAAWIELGLSHKPDAVRNMTTLVLRSAHQSERILPPETSIAHVYEEAGHELLILGEPGTGKSLLLLTLAQELVSQAEREQNRPLPAILPLSSWAVKRLPLQEWMTEQLTQLYDIPAPLAREWVQAGHILPFLDGLDEMDFAARPACIAAINAYHRTYLTALVICCRTREYGLAAAQQRLTLHQAVVIQPLTTQQVKEYLEIAGEPFAELRQILKENSALQELVTTPLMLNVVLLAYRETSIRSLPTVSDQLQKQVWTDYIERMVVRKGDEKRYPLQQTHSWLGWLARQMRARNLTVFYLEHVQPDWLAKGYQRTYMWLGVRLPAIFIGALLCIMLQLLFFDANQRKYILFFGITGGLLGGLLSLANEGKQHRSQWKIQLALSCLVGIVIGINERSSTGGLITGTVFGVNTFILQWLLLMHFRPISVVLGMVTKHWMHSFEFARRWTTLTQVMQRWHPEQILWVTVLFSVSYEVNNILRNDGLSSGLSDGLSIGLSIGLTSILINTILERYASGVFLTEQLTWTWRSVRNGLFSVRHLRLCLILIGCIVVIVGLGYGLGYGLSDGLSAGLSAGLSEGLSDGLSVGIGYWLLIGLYQSITQEQMKNQDRRVANEGIRRSLRNSIIMGLISGAIIGGTMVLSYGLRSWLYSELRGGGYYGLVSGLSHGIRLLPSLTVVSIILVCLISGGLAAWRHYIIRSLLSRVHVFPWSAPHFLDDATARILLRHVGGGYTFIHRLLLDHLADT